MKKIVSGIILTLLLTSMLTLAFNIQPVKSGWTGTVYIRADGSIDPPDAPIITYDNITYTLTDDITSSADGIIVERDNIVIDGASYTLRGAGIYYSYGISLYGRTNMTIQNIQIENFYYGIQLSYSSNNNISGNTITGNSEGIWLSYSSNNSINGNIIGSNIDIGIYVDASSYYNIISGNNITNNAFGITLYSPHNKIYHNNFLRTRHASFTKNVWDDGYPSGGNYWSDYVDVDLYSGPYQNETGSDGIWDHPYVIDEYNIDRYPLVNPWIIPEFPLSTILPLFLIIILVVTITLKKKRKEWSPILHS